MKHRFTGETCVYCGKAPADTSDHVLGRGFFLIEQRGDIPQIPACKRCNGQKATLEHYLSLVLPFGAKHSDAVANLKTLVAHRLNHPSNTKIRRQLEKDAQRSSYTTVGIDSSRVEKLFAMIAKGLAWHHFHVPLGDGFSSMAAVFDKAASELFTRMLSRGHCVAGNLGNGTFTYEGAQGAYPEETVWRFSFYGGVDFGGDPSVPEASSLAVAFTGRTEVIRNIKYRESQRNRRAPEVGRNESCPCGSGKKYKKCHGASRSLA